MDGGQGVFRWSVGRVCYDGQWIGCVTKAVSRVCYDSQWTGCVRKVGE